MPEKLQKLDVSYQRTYGYQPGGQLRIPGKSFWGSPIGKLGQKIGNLGHFPWRMEDAEVDDKLVGHSPVLPSFPCFL